MKRLPFLLALAVGIGIAARLPAADRALTSEDLKDPAVLESVVGPLRFQWRPGPASLHVGAISDGQLLSYQWEPTSEPEPHRSLGNPSRLVPAVQWIAAKEWNPKDIRWFLVDLAGNRVRPLTYAIDWSTVGRVDLAENRAQPLTEDLRRKATVLDFLLTYGDSNYNHAPHRWRWDREGFWYTHLSLLPGGRPMNGTQLVRTPLDTQHPEASPDGDVRSPLDRLTEAELEVLRKDAQTQTIRLVPDRKSPAPGFIGAPHGNRLLSLGEMRFVVQMADQGMPWWADFLAGGGAIDLDFLPLTQHDMAVCVLCGNGMSVWTNRWEWALWNGDVPLDTNEFHEKGDFYLKEGEWQRQATFKAPFCEPFHLAAHGGTYFLVTDETGEVYAAEEHDGEWETRTVWLDATRPIVAMVTLSDDPTAFVFGNDFYMKLGRDTEPRPCRDVTDGPKEYADPLRTVYECGRVLYEKGELSQEQGSATSSGYGL